MSDWKKEPAIKSNGPACLCCGTPTDIFQLDRIIAVGFGGASVTKDGKCVYDEQMVSDENYWTGADAEYAAATDPEHDWRISIFAPLYDADYQRHGPEQWVLIRRGEGFA